MKKLLLLVIIFTLSMTVYGQYAVNKTASIDSTLMHNMKYDFDGGDVVAERQWYYFVQVTPGYSSRDSMLIADDLRYEEPFMSDIYTKDAIWGAFGLDMPDKIALPACGNINELATKSHPLFCKSAKKISKINVPKP